MPNARKVDQLNRDHCPSEKSDKIWMKLKSQSQIPGISGWIRRFKDFWSDVKLSQHERNGKVHLPYSGGLFGVEGNPPSAMGQILRCPTQLSSASITDKWLISNWWNWSWLRGWACGRCFSTQWWFYVDQNIAEVQNLDIHGGFQKWGVPPIAGWFIIENPIK